MPNITVGRYNKDMQDWQGWLEPEDKTWIMFIRADGSPIVYLDRDPETGAVFTHQGDAPIVDMRVIDGIERPTPTGPSVEPQA